MIPIRDRNPSGTVPWAVYCLIGVNVLVFLFEVRLPKKTLEEFIFTFGLVPQNVTAALRGKADVVVALIVPAITCMFLHGGWLHLIGNMWFLLIFGDNVEGRLRHVPFVLFYLLCGLLASAGQYLLNPSSPVPTVGASGAIAGVLGAYIVCWPRARVLTLVPLFYLVTFVELPAVFVLGIWFVIQFFGGVGSLGASFASGGVAYWAHVGGFAAGAVLIKLLPGRKRPPGRRRPPRPSLPPRYWR